MKAYILILAMSLIGHDLVAEVVPQDFQTVDQLIAHVKKEDADDVRYDSERNIVGVQLRPDFSTDHNLRLLSEIKSIRYLLIANGFVSTNGILALADCPKLTNLCLVCGGRYLVSALPGLTNLQSLRLSQTSYHTNDAIYLAKMTNLMALNINGGMPQTRDEWLSLSTLPKLRKLVVSGIPEYVTKVDTNVFSRFNPSTQIVLTSDPADVHAAWKSPFE